MKNKPNFFIVGAAKSGTTSLYYHLKQHPEVYLCPIKEPNFFSTDIKIENFSSAYRKRTTFADNSYFNTLPLREMQLSFIKNGQQYAKLFQDVIHEKIICEASTSYLYASDAAKNIFEFNPASKILIILRNPIARTFSHYLMAVRYGFTSLNFRQAIEKDLASPNKGWGQSELFIELSLYYEQLKRYFNIFPKNQIKIILFEELITHQEKTIKDVYSFLAINPQYYTILDKKNAAETPKFPITNKLLTDIGIKKVILDAINNKTKEKLKSYLFSKKKNQLSQTDKTFLLSFFKEDIQKTSKLIDIDLSHWLQI